MQKFKITIFMAIALLLAMPVSAAVIHVGVDGLVCAFCVKGIERGFKRHDAVATVNVDMDEKLITLITKEDKILEDSDIEKIISDAGYNITNIHRAD
jgi:copper chaperone CopZ